jgi:hypothetical protein
MGNTFGLLWKPILRYRILSRVNGGQSPASIKNISYIVFVSSHSVLGAGGDTSAVLGAGTLLPTVSSLHGAITP